MAPGPMPGDVHPWDLDGPPTGPARQEMGGVPREPVLQLSQGHLVHAKLDTIASLVGAIYQQLGTVVDRLNRIELSNLSPELRAEAQAKARELYDKLKKEADAEIEEILKKRAEKGIPNDGDAVTEKDLEELDLQ